MVRRERGPGFDRTRATQEQDGWAAHAAFMNGLASTQLIAFGGPAGDGGSVVHAAAAADAAAILRRLAEDPWTPSGVLRTSAVDPWTIWIGDTARVRDARADPLYLVSYGPGTSWQPGTERRRQSGWEAHAAFIDALVDDGVVLFGGPVDGEHAVLVMRHDDVTALHHRLIDDPWVGGVLVVDSVERWTLWL